MSVRDLAPPPAPPGAEESGLYRPVPQLTKLPNFTLTPEWVEPEQMQAWLLKAEADPQFRQRPLYPAQVRRYSKLLKRKGFVHFMPDGPLCFDPDGMMLNGRNRGTASAKHDEPTGFCIIRNVPRWMFRYMDTGKSRSQKDIFHISGRGATPQTQAAMRLGMRYEEFIRGMRGKGNGWHQWNQGSGDELTDVDDYLERRGELADLHASCQRVYLKSRLIQTSLMVFRFFQELAWQGDEAEAALEAFWLALETGAATSPQAPAVVLRAWANDSFRLEEQIPARRELHLLLLFDLFRLHVQGDRIPRITWAKGLRMTMPYHPDGHETAVKNVIAGLDELDRTQ